MENADHPAISAFCEIITQLTEDSQRTAIFFTSAAIGMTPDRTGVEFSTDRQLRHLYWDHAVEDLGKRLTYLVETVGLREQLVVQGVAAYLENHFAMWADPELSQRNQNNQKLMLQALERQRSLPAEERQGKRTDEQLEEFAGKLKILIDSAEARRLASEETLHFLRSKFETQFTLEFWDGLNRQAIDEARRRIGERFDRGDDPPENSESDP